MDRLVLDQTGFTSQPLTSAEDQQQQAKALEQEHEPQFAHLRSDSQGSDGCKLVRIAGEYAEQADVFQPVKERGQQEQDKQVFLFGDRIPAR